MVLCKFCQKCEKEIPADNFSVGKRICKNCQQLIIKSKNTNQPNQPVYIPKRYLSHCANCGLAISREKHKARKYCDKRCFATDRFY